MTQFDQLAIKRRRKFFVDRAVQGAVLKQALKYWAWTTIVFGLVIGYCRITPAWLANSEEPWGSVGFHLGPYALASAVLFPIVISSSVRFSNRFAGPMVRVRRALKSLARGEAAEKLKFRDGDYWIDVADDINSISARITAENSAAANPQAQQQSTPVLESAVDGAFGTESTPSPQSHA
jgi:hypothetical protein